MGCPGWWADRGGGSCLAWFASGQDRSVSAGEKPVPCGTVAFTGHERRVLTRIRTPWCCSSDTGVYVHRHSNHCNTELVAFMTGNKLTADAAMETDRRTVLKASGAAAGAGALGLASTAVYADDSNEHYIVASDTHLGSPYAHTEDFRTFLTEDLPDIDPDALVLAGDIWEFWFRGMSSTILEYNWLPSQLLDLQDNGTDVTIVAGNHDRRLYHIGDSLGDDAPGAPWQIGNEYYFESGDREFVANHGDDGDPLQMDPLSNLLCVTDDNLGMLLVDLHDWLLGDDDSEEVGETGTTTVETTRYGWHGVTLADSYDDPVVVTSPAGSNGDAPIHPQVRNLADDGGDRFGIRLESWDADVSVQGQPAEQVQYAVVERGEHVLASSTEVVADATTADGEWHTVTFPSEFASTPIVLADVQTPDAQARPLWNTTPAIARVRNVSPSGFDVRVETPEGERVSEREVGFVATEPGLVGAEDGLIESFTTTDVDGDVRSVSFSREFEEDPTVIASLQTAASDRPAIPRIEQLDARGVDISLQGENGTAVNAGESVSYLALGTGRITALDTTAASSAAFEASLESEWQRIVESSDVLSWDQVPDTPPGMAGSGRHVSTTSTTTSNLLDIFPDRFVVFGHTHSPDLGERHVNSGSWTGRSSSLQRTYVEIDAGEVTVWDWEPDGREVLYTEAE